MGLGLTVKKNEEKPMKRLKKNNCCLKNGRVWIQMVCALTD